MAFMCFMEQGCCLNLYKYSRGRGEKEWLWPARVATFCARNAPYPLHTKLKWVILNFEFPIKKRCTKNERKNKWNADKKEFVSAHGPFAFPWIASVCICGQMGNFKFHQTLPTLFTFTQLHSTLISSICNDTKQLAANLFVHLNPNKEKINMQSKCCLNNLSLTRISFTFCFCFSACCFCFIQIAVVHMHLNAAKHF